MAIRPKKQIDDPASMPSGANSGYKGSGATGTGGLGGLRIGVSRGAAKVAGKAAEKLSESKVAEKIANTKPVVKASEKIAKQVQKNSIAKGKKAGEVVRKMQQKTKSEQIAKNSVKIKPGTKPNSIADAQRKSANQAATNTAAERKSGKLAQTTGSRVITNKPKETIKIRPDAKKKG